MTLSEFRNALGHYYNAVGHLDRVIRLDQRMSKNKTRVYYARREMEKWEAELERLYAVALDTKGEVISK